MSFRLPFRAPFRLARATNSVDSAPAPGPGASPQPRIKQLTALCCLVSLAAAQAFAAGAPAAAEPGATATPAAKTAPAPATHTISASEATPAPPTDEIAMPELPIRIVRDGERFNLESLCVQMRDTTGAEVILIGTIHLGDEHYYHECQKLVDACDRVFYEDMAGGTLALAWQLRHKAKAGKLTDKERDLLEQINRIDYDPTSEENRWAAAHGLKRQTQIIDYSAPRFVWADIRQQDMPALLQKHGPQPPFAIPRLKDPELSGNVTPERRMRSRLAVRLSEPRGAHHVMKTPFMTERDLRCMEIFDAKRGTARRIGILYGTMHLPHLVSLLRERGFRVQSLRWYRAFDY